MTRMPLPAPLLAAATASAIVGRDDGDDAEYRVRMSAASGAATSMPPLGTL